MKLEFFDGISWYSVATESFVNAKVFDINSNTSGQLNINRLSGYPANISVFLRGDGTWASPTSSAIDINTGTTGQLSVSRLSGYPANPSVYLNGNGGWSDPLQITVNAATYGLTINNTNASSTATGVNTQSNGVYTSQFGYNASTGTGYVWSSGALLFYTNATAQMQILAGGTVNLFANNLQTTGSINAQTGTLIANNLAAYNSGVIVCAHPLSIQDTGTYKPYNGSYGYLNSSGNIGTSSGQNPYSINCNNRVKASEFNAVSSIKTKNIEGSGDAIEQEALEIFNKIPLFKYNYKDKIKNGEGASFGVIAESLQEVLPYYVSEDKNFVPNILQSCSIRPIREYTYELVFKEKLTRLEGDKLQLILANKSIEVCILNNNPKRLTINCTQKLPSDGFAYGTFESCPSVTKNKLFELSMVVLKNALQRLSFLEAKLNNL